VFLRNYPQSAQAEAAHDFCPKAKVKARCEHFFCFLRAVCVPLWVIARGLPLPPSSSSSRRKTASMANTPSLFNKRMHFATRMDSQHLQIRMGIIDHRLRATMRGIASLDQRPCPGRPASQMPC
jgi:hypothetical protein